jgi:hypothetical protein
MYNLAHNMPVKATNWCIQTMQFPFVHQQAINQWAFDYSPKKQTLGFPAKKPDPEQYYSFF